MQLLQILTLSGIFLYIFSFSFYLLSKRFTDSTPALILSFAYASLGISSFMVNPLDVFSAPIPWYGKGIILLYILGGWFITGFMFFSGFLLTYLKIKTWFIRGTHHPVVHEHVFNPPQEVFTPRTRRKVRTHPTSSEIVRKLLESD